MIVKILFLFHVLSGVATAEPLPIAGIEISQEPGWKPYAALRGFSEQPFEKVWIHPDTQAIRMVSTVFSEPSAVCTNEKLSLEKKNFLTLKIPVDPKSALACAFEAKRGKENFKVAIRNVIRKLPNGKRFQSQAIFIEKGGKIKGFQRWVASARLIRARSRP